MLLGHKRISRRLNGGSESGSVILSALMISVGLATAMYLVPDILQKYELSSEHDREVFEARMLARDLVDLGKYLIAYERVFYTTNPTSIPTAPVTLPGQPPQNRFDALKEIWASPASTDPLANDLFHVCDGFDPSAGYASRNALTVGLNQDPALCPVVLRSNQYDGPMIENGALQAWAKPSPVVAGSKPLLTLQSTGIYRLKLDLTDALKVDPTHFIELNSGQKILNSDKIAVKGTLIFDFYAAGSGYTTQLAERYIKISSRVEFGYKGPFGLKSTGDMVTETETIMMVPSTPKDFALFMVYTQNEDGASLPFSGVTPIANEKWKDHIQLSPASEVHGRTYYRGDIESNQGDLSDLPTFHDVVVLDGNLSIKLPGGAVVAMTPTAANIDLVQKRFEKGLIPNFSSRRLILTGGDQTSVTGEGPLCGPTAFSGQGGYDCIKKGGIAEAFQKVITTCGKGKLVVSQSTSAGAVNACVPNGAGGFNSFNGICRNQNYDPSPNSDPSCTTADLNWMTVQAPLSGYAHQIELNNTPWAFIFAATSSLSITAKPDVGNSVNIYGTVLGGKIKMAAPLMGTALTPGTAVHFYSVANWTADQPGMNLDLTGVTPASPLDGAHWANRMADTQRAAISTALTGMPVIWSSREGMR